MGAFVNDQWANFTLGHCGDDNDEAQELGATAIKSFFGPERPYVKGQTDVYKKLLAAWGGVPDHLGGVFGRVLAEEPDTEVGEPDVDLSILQQIDAKTMCDRGVIVAGDPEHCIEGARRHQESGADQLMLLMQTDQIPHEKAMRSIELFGTQVAPRFQDRD